MHVDDYSIEANSFQLQSNKIFLRLINDRDSSNANFIKQWCLIKSKQKCYPLHLKIYPTIHYCPTTSLSF